MSSSFSSSLILLFSSLSLGLITGPIRFRFHDMDDHDSGSMEDMEGEPV
jgi:hypothetical protein